MTSTKPAEPAPASNEARAPSPPCSSGSNWGAVLLAVAGALLAAGRHVPATAVWFERHASLANLPEHLYGHLDDILLVPIGAVVVVFARCCLGLRMLGPFRPILIGVAFFQTGALQGSLFMVVVLGLVTLLRPRLRGRGLPYFGRLSLMLCAVVTIEIVAILIADQVGDEELLYAALFPIVVLTLTADGFARVLDKSGPVAAAWRGGVTLGLALLISVLGELPPVVDLQFRYPELVLLEMAAIALIARAMRWNLLERLNPLVARESD